jgi:hypothetical protein
MRWRAWAQLRRISCSVKGIAPVYDAYAFSSKFKY